LFPARRWLFRKGSSQKPRQGRGFSRRHAVTVSSSD
jgi:hypothetical protein